MTPTLHLADYLVVITYLAVVMAIGAWVARRTHDDDDLFLAGRSLGWGVIGLSLFASNISSTTLIGLSGAAYASGIAVANYEWMAGLVLAGMAFVVVPIYLRGRIDTVPQYLEQRFGPVSRKYFSAITIFLSIVVDTAGGLYAGALVLDLFFPRLVLWQTCVILALFAGIYTAAGGLKAVVYTDAVQAIILLLGSAFIAMYVFSDYGYSWAAVREAIPADQLSLIRPLDDPQLPWLGTLTGVPILGIWYWSTNQYITQRVLGARNENHARWGATLGGMLKLLPLFIMVIPGAMAVRTFPNLENPDQVYPMMIGELLPVGLTGLVLAGLIAAIMSSIDSTLNSASTLVVKDFNVGSGRVDKEGGMLRVGRITTLVFMAIAAIWAPMIANFGGLFDYLQQAFAILVPPVVAIFVGGLFTDRGDGRTAMTTLIVGHVTAIGLFVLAQLGVWNLHFTITAGIVTLLSYLLFLGLGRVRDPMPEGVRWTPDMVPPPEGTPLWKDYRIYAVLSVVITVVSVIAFW